MPDLRQQLEGSLGGRACLVGVGNVDLGDDGFGVRLAERVEAGLGRREPRGCRLEARTTTTSPERRLEARMTTTSPGRLEARTTCPDVVVAGVTPEAHLAALRGGQYDTVIFLDAVEFGGDPGAAVWLEAEQMAVRCPQISTHKLSLGLLARLIEDGRWTRVRLLGSSPRRCGRVRVCRRRWQPRSSCWPNGSWSSRGTVDPWQTGVVGRTGITPGP
ncbi:MAG: hydrogenase maturation protease [Verrucomicrobia bacterium]|nr:hydrogenase maturation protease [Verrucomicrobiota bacterium]